MKMNTKKSQFVIPAVILIGFIIVAGVLFFSQQNKGESEDTAREDTTQQPITLPDKTQDSNPDSNLQPTTPENTPIPTPTPETCSFTGKWETLWVKERTNFDTAGFSSSPRSKALAIFRYTGNCVTDVYLEAGITPETRVPLALAPVNGFPIGSTPSWCDGNMNYYGHLWKGVKPGQLLQGIDFKPKAPDQEGSYRMTIGAYTGCIGAKTRTDRDIKASGVIITDNQFNIKVSNTFSEGIGGSASNSWVKVVG